MEAAHAYRRMGIEERVIRDEIEDVAARYRVWNLREDRRRLARLRQELSTWMQVRSEESGRSFRGRRSEAPAEPGAFLQSAVHRSG
jgi:hypothetical protein